MHIEADGERRLLPSETVQDGLGEWGGSSFFYVTQTTYNLLHASRPVCHDPSGHPSVCTCLPMRTVLLSTTQTVPLFRHRPPLMYGSVGQVLWWSGFWSSLGSQVCRSAGFPENVQTAQLTPCTRGRHRHKGCGKIFGRITQKPPAPRSKPCVRARALGRSKPGRNDTI